MEKTIEQAIREVTGATDAEQFAQMNETAYKVAVKVYELTYLERQKEQQPAEWSEEEKMHFANAILAAEKEWGVNSYTARFLESLRDKKCNSRWNPSEEQMAALLNDEYMQEQPEVDFEKEELVGVAESPLKTFPRVNDFECGGSYRH